MYLFVEFQEGHSCPDYPLVGLLQCAPQGATLEKYLEATANIECSGMDRSGGP